MAFAEWRAQSLRQLESLRPARIINGRSERTMKERGTSRWAAALRAEYRMLENELLQNNEEKTE